MAEIRQAKETLPNKKNGRKTEPVASLEQVDEPGGKDLFGDLRGAGRAGSIEAQASQLSDSRFQLAQRHAIASQIGKIQGNMHLQRVVQYAGRNGKGSPSNNGHKGNGHSSEGLSVEGLAGDIEWPGAEGAPMKSGTGVPPNGNGKNGSGHSPVQRQEEGGAEENAPGEEERARALAAAKAAEGIADQAANVGRSEIEKSQNEEAVQQENTLAAKEQVEQAKAEAAPPSAVEPAAERAAPEEMAGEKAPAPEAGAAPVTAAAAGKEAPGETAEAKAPASAQEDAAFQKVVEGAKAVGEKERAHAPAKAKADEAQSAAEAPSSEIEARAEANQVGEMASTEPPGFDTAAFKAQLMQRVAEAAPKTAEEADNFKKDNKLGSVKDELQSVTAEQQADSKRPLEEKAAAAPDTGSIEPKPVTPLQAAEPGTPPPDLGASAAAPKAKGQSEVETPLRADSQKIDDKMAEANVTEEQLKKSNEPEFTAALGAKQDAQANTVAAPQAYRQFEQGEVTKAQGEAVALAQEKAQAMHADRTGLFLQVASQQEQTKGQDEQARAKVAADIQKIYEETKSNVERMLGELEGKVEKAFDEGATAAKQAFEDYVTAKMEAYKEERYGGWLGWARWLKDKLLGMPAEVNAFYAQGRELFLQKMDAVIDNVAAIVARGITEAKAEIADGKKKILAYIAQLPDDLKKVGQEAYQGIQGKFDALTETVNAKVDDLVSSLANKYQEHLQAVDARIEEMKAANAGLVEKAINAVVGVIKTIIELGKMLLSVLVKIAQVVGKILEDPIGFLGNLIDAVKQGFSNFVANIKKHLISGLLAWLTGALGPMGLKLPEDIFSLEGIFSLVMQVLGIGWDYIRAKAVKLLGEPVVKALETGFEIFQILISEGPIGLWKYVQDKFTDLKETVLGMIQDTIIGEVIEAGVKWILSLLTPAGAFIKAAQAIYKIVKFFFEKAAQIMDFINSLMDGIAAVVAGTIGGAATLIETALAKALPLIIGFLASLLGIDDLAGKIQKIIKKVRARIDKAIDGVLMKAKAMARKVMGKLGLGKEKEKAESSDVKAGLQTLYAEERAKAGDGQISKEEAEAIAQKVKAKHSVFKSITPVEGADSWNYEYVVQTALATGHKPKEGAAAKMNPVVVEFICKQTEFGHDPSEFERQVKLHESGINAMNVAEWLKNYRRFLFSSGVGRENLEKEANQARKEARKEALGILIRIRVKEIEKYNEERLRTGKIKRKPSDMQVLRQAKKWAESQLAGTAALHGPDWIAGGTPSGIVASPSVVAIDTAERAATKLKTSRFGTGSINSSIGSQWKSRVDSLLVAAKAIPEKDRVKTSMACKLVMKVL